MLTTARHASTIVVIRDGDPGPDGTIEVLLLRRSDVGAFAGHWVFPGGRVDETDAGADEIERARCAGIREAREEVGLDLSTSRLITWSHWSPPPIQPKRFLTWFFVAQWSGDDVVVDGHEIVDYAWHSPTDALAKGLMLAPPTFVTLHQLAGRRDVAEVLGSGPAGGVEHFVTRPAKIGGDLVLMWHGDGGYDGNDPMSPGPRHRLTVRNGRTTDYVRSGVHPLPG